MVLRKYLLILRISIVTLTQGQILETHSQVSALWLHLKLQHQFCSVFPLVSLKSVHSPCKHSSDYKLESSKSKRIKNPKISNDVYQSKSLQFPNEMKQISTVKQIQGNWHASLMANFDVLVIVHQKCLQQGQNLVLQGRHLAIHKSFIQLIKEQESSRQVCTKCITHFWTTKVTQLLILSSKKKELVISSPRYDWITESHADFQQGHCCMLN